MKSKRELILEGKLAKAKDQIVILRQEKRYYINRAKQLQRDLDSVVKDLNAINPLGGDAMGRTKVEPE